MDTDEIMQKQVEQLEKEKKEMQEKLRTQEKKVRTTLLFISRFSQEKSNDLVKIYLHPPRYTNRQKLYGVQSI